MRVRAYGELTSHQEDLDHDICLYFFVIWCIWLERSRRLMGSQLLQVLKARCIANLYPVVNEEQLQDFISSLVLAQIVFAVSQRYFVSSNAISYDSFILLMLLLIPLYQKILHFVLRPMGQLNWHRLRDLCLRSQVIALCQRNLVQYLSGDRSRGRSIIPKF